MTILQFGNWRLHNGPVMAAQVLEGVRELAGLQEQLEREYRHKRHELEATLQAERVAAVARGYEDGKAGATQELAQLAAFRMLIWQRFEQDVLEAVMRGLQQVLDAIPSADLLQAQIRSSLQAAGQEGLLRIHVAPGQLPHAESLLAEIAQQLPGSICEVQANAALRAQDCLVESSCGIIDGSLSVQLQAIRLGIVAACENTASLISRGAFHECAAIGVAGIAGHAGTNCTHAQQPGICRPASGNPGAGWRALCHFGGGAAGILSSDIVYRYGCRPLSDGAGCRHAGAGTVGAGIARCRRQGWRDIDGIADWLFAPWLDALEAALGVSMHINQVLFDAPRVHSVRHSVARPAGRTGSVAFSGAPFAALARHESANRRQILTILSTLPLSATWKIGATGLRLADLVTLQPHAVVFPDSRKLVCSFTTLTGALHLLGHLQGQLFTVHTTEIIDMQSCQESDDEGLVALENLSAEIDIVLERVVMPLSQVATLASGSVLPLTQLSTGRNVTLYCRSLPFARGEIVVVGQRLGILLLEKVNFGVASEAPRAIAEVPPRRRRDD